MYKISEFPVYVCDAQRIDKMSKVMLMNNFPHNQIIICTDGGGIICSQKETEQTVSKGDAVLVEKSAMFSIRPENDFMSLKRIAFNGAYSSDYMQYFDFGVTSVFQMNEETEVCAENVIKAFENGEGKTASVYLYEFIGICGELYNTSKKQYGSAQERFARSGYEYIKENIWRANLSIDEFAQKNGMDRQYMDRLFLKYFGKNSEELIYFYRMEFAKHTVFLAGNDMCRRYCADCGFATDKEFEKAFLSYTGMSVRDYLDITWGGTWR